jgi:Protein of unknown function with HXXEE motif
MLAKTQDRSNFVMNWLVVQWQWPFACLFAAVAMLLLTPVWLHTMGTALALIMLQLPIYMVHEWEEHTGDRFRKYINQNIAGGRDALTPNAAFWINALGVWGLDLAAIYLACFVNLSFGLVVFYLPIVNALTHIREAIARREYNPGLWTSLALFLPLGSWGLYEVALRSGAAWLDHVVGAAIAVAVHAAIIIYLVVRISRLRSAAATG